MTVTDSGESLVRVSLRATKVTEEHAGDSGNICGSLAACCLPRDTPPHGHQLSPHRETSLFWSWRFGRLSELLPV
jgi:hypothetical protein